ncbi:MAG: hypothetical protein PHZ03_01470 [Syntrophomonas sp.]|nr:hypothetical protein [Syntrophomonas sp.]
MADKTYIVKITAQAEEQLQEIIKYISSELKAPKAALCLLDEIEHRPPYFWREQCEIKN